MDIWKKNMWICTAASFIVSIGMSQMAPIMPLYIEELGVTDADAIAMWAGIVFGCNFISLAIFSPIWGRLSDKYGRKPMMLRASAWLGLIMVGMGLIRFRSAQGKAEEMLMLFVSVVTGALNGLGYVGYAGIFAVALPLLFVGLFSLNVLKNRRLSGEKLLKITIPENLAYSDAFADTFGHYLKEYEQVGVKTTGMGSMFRISYRIVMKDEKEEKEMIDELRIKNGNLEISVLPYVEDAKAL